MKVGDLVKANPAWILGDEIQRAAGLRLLKNGIVVEVRHGGWVVFGSSSSRKGRTTFRFARVLWAASAAGSGPKSSHS